MNIIKITASEFDPFFKLMVEVECGNHFDFTNIKHITWLNNKISTYYYRGVKFFGCFTENSSPIGFIAVLIEEGPEGIDCIGKKAEITDVGICPEFRGKGHGSKLLEHVENYCKKSGIYSLYVSTSASSYKVIAYYGKNGYMPVATLPCMYGPDDEGNIYMRKVLY